jgi:predicted transcriptional regulator
VSDHTQQGTVRTTQMKPLPVRLNEDVRAQLDILAQLNDRSATEEIRLAIEAWIERSKSDPAIQQRAEYARAEIERAATTQRNAIAAIFDAPAGAPKEKRPPAPASTSAASARTAKPTGS